MQQDKKVIEMKEQIKSYMAKKDYYTILGLEKTCQEADLKKAYKKLALRFHPDKNCVEGSKEVFKKVSNAYATLSDPKRRADYDRYGSEEDRQSMTYHSQPRYHTHEDDIDEIFRAFFGNVAPRRRNNPHYQHFTFNMGGGAYDRNNQAQAQGQFPLFYFLLFIVAMYILQSLFSGFDRPQYSLQISNSYRHRRVTSILRTPYFVRQQFLKQAKNEAFRVRVENSVDYEYLIKLKQKCDSAIDMKNRYLYHAKQYNQGPYKKQLLNQAAAVDMTHCQRQQELYERYPEHIRGLFNY